MPYPVLYPMINQRRYSFASLEVTFNGLPILGIKSLNYSESLEPGDVYGTAPQLIGDTRGKQKATCDFEMLQFEYMNLIATLGAAGVGYMETPFIINVIYFEPGSLPITDTVLGVRITKDENSNSEGADANYIKATCRPFRVLRNGLPAVTPIGVGI